MNVSAPSWGSELDALRLEKLRRQLLWAKEHSSFYGNVFAEAGLDILSLRSIQQFRELPIFLDKDRHRKEQERSIELEGHPFGTFLCVEPRDVASVYATSGTTGDPTFYLFDAKDRAIHELMFHRAFTRMGLRPGDSLLWGFGLGMWVGTSMFPAMISFGLRVIPVGADAGSERLLRMAKLTRPDVLLATPSYLEYLIERAPDVVGCEVADLGFKRIITGGEPGAGLPRVRERITRAFDAPLCDLYGPAFQFSFASCGQAEYSGLHAVGLEYGLAEDIVDPVTGEPVDIRDGAIGAMVLTELEKRASPVIRYAYGDVLELRIGDCACGFEGLSVFVRGRADDMLIVKGVNVFPAAVKNVVAEFAPAVTGALRIEASGLAPRVEPPLRIRVEADLLETATERDALAEQIRERIKARLHVNPLVSIVDAGSLGRSERKTSLVQWT